MFYTMINIIKGWAIIVLFQRTNTTGQFNISLIGFLMTFKLMKTLFKLRFITFDLDCDFQMPKKCYGINGNDRPYWCYNLNNS